MAKLIFVAGLDNRNGDLTASQQADLLKKGYGDVEVVFFRYNATDAKIIEAINANIGSVVVVFSAGCRKSQVVASHLKSINQPLTLLHINEPYSADSGIKSIIDSAIKLGVPASNVYSGGVNATGENIVGNTKLPNRVDHLKSLTALGKYLASIATTSGTSGTSGSSGTSGTSGTSAIGLTPSVAPVTQNGTSGEIAPEVFKSALSGKIFIKKKSGPGEITGVTEQELQVYSGFEAANALFSDIQFTEPGDYVITVSSDNPNIDSKEYKIKILAADNIVAQEESKGQEPKKEEPVSGTRPIIAQIDQKTIKIKGIEMDQDPTGPAGQGQYTDGLGYTPFVWYNGFQIREEDIRSLQLYHVGIIPKITLTFADPNGIFKDNGTPMNDTVMELFLNSASENLKFIHYVFKVEEFNAGKAQPGQTFTVRGTMNIPDLYVITNQAYNDTSFNTLRTICKELGLGFNSNIDNTNDKMSWRNTNKKPYEFMEEIIAHSYINDESYMAGYIDFYYHFNYVDLEKEYMRDISKDVGLDTSSLAQQSTKNEVDRIMPLVLSNDKAQSSSSNYIESFKTKNESLKRSLKEGYLTVTKAYDRVKKQFLVFNVDSTQSDPSKNKLLRGAEQDSKFFDKNIKTIFTGKLDEDNSHSNYNYAKTQNRINLNNLNNIQLEVSLPNANYNLYKYLKVKVNLINDTTTPQEVSILNNRYSGEYIIADIEWHWSKGKMSQKLRLIRKELSKDVNEVKEDPPVQKPKEEKQVNENPLPPGTTFSAAVTAPNAVYTVGQKYLVQTKDNKLYELTVKELLNNGVDVVGTLKETQRKNI